MISRTLTTLLFVVAASMPAQSPQLKLVVILSRHGVRSPTWTQERLNAYSASPWPTWPVAPGELTPHGFDLLKRLGGFERSNLASKGLFSSSGCEEASSVFIDADTDQRTLASGRALAQGLFPACPPSLHALPEGVNDPLFHTDLKPTSQQAAAALAQLTQRLTVPANLPDARQIDMLQNILYDCPTEAACLPAHPPETSLPSGQFTAVPGKGDHLVDLKGSLPTASTLSEDLLLEYADGMPMDNVGWGHVDAAKLRRLLSLHTAYFDLIHRTTALARLGNGDLLLHIAHTLQQGVEGKPVPGALGLPGQKLVLLVGHDTNLAAVAALLGIHWSLDGRTDDTPPGTQMAFELWQMTPASAVRPATYAVHTTVTMQTLEQMRDLASTIPASTSVVTAGCPATGGCPWSGFFQTVTSVTAPQ